MAEAFSKERSTKSIPYAFSLPHRSKILTQILILAFLLYAPDKIVAQIRSGGAQLRTAVAANSVSELQKVEVSMAGTESGALARLLRGYLRLQAKDYPAAISLLNDPNLGQLTFLGDYAAYFRGQATAGTGRSQDAEREFRHLAQTYPTSLLAREALLQAAASAMARSDYQTAVDTVELLAEKAIS